MLGFTFFESYDKAIRNLPDAMRLSLYDAINDYMFRDEEPSLEDTAMCMFELMRPTLDKSKARGRAGAKKSNANQTESKQNQNESNEIKTESNEIKVKLSPPKEKDKEKDKELFSARAREEENRERKRGGKPPPVDARNRFNRFRQQEYDFEEIKRKLVNNG